MRVLLAFPWMREHLAEVCKLAAANILKLLRESFHRWLLLGAAVDRWQPAWLPLAGLGQEKERWKCKSHTHTPSSSF